MMTASRSRFMVVGILVAAFAGGIVAQWVLGGCRLMEAQGAAGQTVRAERFVLVGPDGREQGVIQATAAGAQIVLRDAGASDRVRIGAVPMAHATDLPAWGLTVLDSAGQDRAAIGLAEGETEASGAGMAVWDPEGTLRIGIGEGEAGVGIGLMDPDGNSRLGIGMGPGGWGTFSVKGPDGQDLWTATDEVRKAKSFVVVDDEGRERAVLGMVPEGPTLVLNDAEGNKRFSLGNTGGEGAYWALGFFDAEGTHRFTAGARDDGTASGMGIQDRSGTVRVGIGADADGGSGLEINNQEGTKIIGAGSSGGGDITLHHPFDGRVVWRASQHVEEEE